VPRIIVFSLALSLFLLLSLPALGVTPPTDIERAELERQGIDVPAFFKELQERMYPPEDMLTPEPQDIAPGVTEILANFGADVESAPDARLIDFNLDGVIDERDVLALGFAEVKDRRVNNFFGWPGIAPSQGTQYTLFVLCQFQDLTADESHDWDHWDTMLNSQGELTHGSFNEYWDYSSYGLLDAWVDVYDSGENNGWITLPNDRSYYTGSNYRQLLYHAMDIIDDDVDFNKYDNDGDGYVDSIIFIYQGSRSDAGNLWPHKGWMSSQYRDGALMGSYVVTDEATGVGTIIHEHAHAMGVPDLYDYSYVSRGIGIWGLQGYGSHLGGQAAPAYSCPFFKWVWGWIEPVVVEENSVGLTLNPYETTGECYKVWSNGEPASEYFLITNYTDQGNHSYLPDDGLLIWHIDEQIPSNNNYLHKMVDIEEADGNDDLDHKTNTGDDTDLYPSDPAIEFTGETYPSSFRYSGSPSGVEVFNISAPGDLMTFDVNVSLDAIEFPFLEDFESGLDDWQVVNEAGTGTWSIVGDKASQGGGSIWLGDPLLDRPNPADVTHLESKLINAEYSLQPTMWFDIKSDLQSGEAWIEISANNGADWTQFYQLPSDVPVWTSYELDLTDFAGALIRLRLSYYGDGGMPGKGLWMDNIELDEPPSIGPFFDDAEDDEYPWRIFDTSGGGGGTSNGTWHRAVRDAHNGEFCWWPGVESQNGPGHGENDFLLSPPIELMGPNEWTLSLWGKHFSEETFDFGFVEITNDRGISWDRLLMLDGYAMDNWTNYILDLSAYQDEKVNLRIRYYSDGAMLEPHGFYVDDIWLTPDFPTNFPSSFGPGASGVDAHDYSGSGMWRLTNDGPGGSTVWSMSDPLTDKPAMDDFDVLEIDAVDLTDATAPVLSFSHKRHTMADDVLAVEISTDGAYSWQAVETFENGADPWTDENIDLSAWTGQRVWLRFNFTAGGSGEGKGWFINAVEIAEAD